jgi:hypothetical protein
MSIKEFKTIENRIKEGLYGYDAVGKELFRQDLFVEYNVRSHPKANKLFSLAWGYGHANGFSEVLSYFSEMVELIK